MQREVAPLGLTESSRPYKKLWRKLVNKKSKRIGILTGGGDAPGLNGIIASTSRILLNNGHEVAGIQDSFDGILTSSYRIITLQDLKNLHEKSGTFLGASNKFIPEKNPQEFIKKYKELCLDGLIVAGGDGTFAALSHFKNEIPIIGVPKTIDNDLSGTDITFGFDTACSVITEAVDSLRSTAEAHRRIIIVETMGRTAGWLALAGGLAGYADIILIPERPFNKSDLLNFIKKRKVDDLSTSSKNLNTTSSTVLKKRGLLVVVSEGAFARGDSAEVAFEVEGSPQKERFGGIGQKLARWFEKEAGWESRQVVLGHLQRSKDPSHTDRFLTMSMGLAAAKLVEKNQWGQAIVYKQGRVQSTSLKELMQPAKLVTPEHPWVKMAQDFNIFI